jgi:hypothetical protein
MVGSFRPIVNLFTKQKMPPARYLAMHWKAIIPKAEKKALLDWIEKHDPNFNLLRISVLMLLA